MRDYANKVAERIKEKSDRFDAEIIEVVKINDETKVGIQMKTKGSNGAPVIYVEDFFNHGINIDECADAIIESVTEGIDALVSEVGDNIPTWDEVKDFVTMRLVNTEYNEKYLADKVHKDLDCGLSIMFDIRKEDYCAAVTTGFAELVGCDELALICASQTSKVGEPMLYDMAEKLFSDNPKNFLEGDEAISSSMLVLTTRDCTFGASAIYRGVGDKIKELVGEYYLLPSSVHEWIIVPESASISVKELHDMVKGANETVVDRKDLLSYGVYKWTKNGLKEVA